MSRQKSSYGPKTLEQGTHEVAEAFPDLSRPQVAGLATWSFGMVLAKSCSLSAVAFFLSKLLAQHYHSVRQRLREFYLEAPAKCGQQRRDLDVTACFGPLLRWILRDWRGRQLAVAVDASTLGSLFTVLCVWVVYRGCAIPVAWKILPATAKASWKEPWLGLLRQFKGVVPADWQVIVLADRGLYAKWLFNGIRKLHWHPMLRINQGGTFRPKGWHRFVPLKDLAPHVGSHWQGRGTAFATKSARLRCTLLAYWGEGHEEAWLIVTDLAAEQSESSWYGLRSWVEQFFKDAKRGGWQWQHTRMQQAERAERLWLALAVATLWLLRVGGADEDEAAAEMPGLMWDEQRGQPRGKRWRLVSVFARGWVVLITCLINQQRQPVGALIPEPWPFVEPTPKPVQTPSEVPRTG